MKNELEEVYSGHYRFGMLGEGQAEIVERHLRANGKRSVLHVGSSSNPIINRNIASLVGKVCCIDILPDAMKNLRKHNIEGISQIVGDVFELPFRDDSFDMVVAIGVPSLYLRPIDGLREIYRVNNPGGRLLVCNKNLGGDVCMDQFMGVSEAIGYHVLECKLGFERHTKTDRYLLVLQK